MGVAVDLAIFTVQEARLELLLIRMKREPYTGKWALPGGRIRGDETVEAGGGARAAREGRHPRRLPGAALHLLRARARSGRALHLRRPPGADSAATCSCVRPTNTPASAGSRSTGCRRWRSITRRSPSYAVKRLRAKLEYTDVARNLLRARPSRWASCSGCTRPSSASGSTRATSSGACSTIGLVKDTGRMRTGQAYRPARLFRFASDR